MFTTVDTGLSLLEYCDIIGINPYLMSQVDEPQASLFNLRGQCNDVIYQSGNNRGNTLGRDEIAQSIQDAENKIASWLGKYPYPKELTDVVAYPREANLNYVPLWRSKNGRLKSIKTTYGEIISVGTYTESLIEANVSVTASDPYGDGFDTAFSLSVTVPTGTLESEISVYFNATDRLDLNRAKTAVRPLNVSLSGTTATITGKIYQIIKPVNYLKLISTGLNITDASILATSLDVYRKTIDISTSGNLVYDDIYGLENCTDNEPCTYSLYSACFSMVDSHLGYVIPIPATYDSDNARFNIQYTNEWFAPTRIECNYIAGVSLEDGKIRTRYNAAIAYLATSLLVNKTCGCDRADQRLNFYRSLPTDDDNNLQTDPTVLTETARLFGNTYRGSIMAYNLLKDDRLHIHDVLTL